MLTTGHVFAHTIFVSPNSGKTNYADKKIKTLTLKAALKNLITSLLMEIHGRKIQARKFGTSFFGRNFITAPIFTSMADCSRQKTSREMSFSATTSFATPSMASV